MDGVGYQMGRLTWLNDHLVNESITTAWISNMITAIAKGHELGFEISILRLRLQERFPSKI